METIPRQTTALLAKIDQIRNSLIKRFENIVALAAINDTSRNATALTTYQMRVETAGLIRTSEDILSLSRQLQDLWLFGQLRTLEHRGSHDQVDSVAKEVAELLGRVVDLQQRQELKTAGGQLNESEDGDQGGPKDEDMDQQEAGGEQGIDNGLGQEADAAS